MAFKGGRNRRRFPQLLLSTPPEVCHRLTHSCITLSSSQTNARYVEDCVEPSVDTCRRAQGHSLWSQLAFFHLDVYFPKSPAAINHLALSHSSTSRRSQRLHLLTHTYTQIYASTDSMHCSCFSCWLSVYHPSGQSHPQVCTFVCVSNESLMKVSVGLFTLAKKKKKKSKYTRNRHAASTLAGRECLAAPQSLGSPCSTFILPTLAELCESSTAELVCTIWGPLHHITQSPGGISGRW